MKNSILKFIVLSIITTFTFSSCSDYLDKQPDDQLDLESVFENKKNMERWLAYIYRGLPEYYTYDGPDAIADELIPSVGWPGGLPGAWPPAGCLVILLIRTAALYWFDTYLLFPLICPRTGFRAGATPMLYS